MKQHWQRVALKIDALTLRERAIIFAMAAVILIMLFNTTLLEPQFAKQKQLTQRIKQDQSKIAGMQGQIQQKTTSPQVDPDKANKARVEDLRQQAAQMQAAFRDMQNGLISPNKMPSVLEEILKKNGALQLVSLKTLSASSVTEDARAEEKPVERTPASIKNKAEAKPTVSAEGAVSNTVYKHGVEIVVQGGYLDIMNYLAQLEAMPWQLLWAKAKLNVDEYPRSTLTLTLFTLSLDKKWLNL
jgi:MSHA biogenesis protein MshJ